MSVSQYTTPENFFDYDYVASAYKTDPAASKEKMLVRLHGLFQKADEKQVKKLLSI